MSRSTHLLLASAVVGALGLPAHAAQRAYVASTGNDANTATGCTLAAPCRGFTAAHSVVDPNGEIVALDAAGYGAVTITKSVTITTNGGFFAGIAASSGSGVTIATAGVNVTLRGLNINGIGGSVGVAMSAGDSLNVENCVISNFGTAGVLIANVPRVQVLDTLVRTNGYGLVMGAGVSGNVVASQFLDNAVLGVFANNAGKVAIRNSVISGSVYGLGADGGPVISVVASSISGNATAGVETHDTAAVWVGYSQITLNGTGLNNGAGTIGTMQNNEVILNTVNTAGVITPGGAI